MAIIIPAILAENAEDFTRKLSQLPSGVDMISIDVMDGTFVPTKSFHDAETIAMLDTEVFFELDLMVNSPLPIIEAFANSPQTVRAIVHAEINDDARSILTAIKNLGLESGIALLPKTDIDEYEHLYNVCDVVLIRGNEPGRAGREMLPETIEKVKNLRSKYPELAISVDIGVNDKTVPALVDAGATYLCVNSAIFAATNPAEAYNSLQKLAEK
ncbi:MAG: hypothetical protein AAB886_02495 [Patescibacteria group bacterium]